MIWIRDNLKQKQLVMTLTKNGSRNLGNGSRVGGVGNKNECRNGKGVEDQDDFCYSSLESTFNSFWEFLIHEPETLIDTL